MTSPNLPDYVASLPPPTDDELWERMLSRFEQLKETVLTGRLERHGEAVGKRLDDGSYRTLSPSAANLIPYVAPIKRSLISERIDQAAELAGKLNGQFAQRLLTPRLAYDWGLFCELAGSIELLAISDTSDMKADRSRVKKGAGQMKWVALQLRDLMAAGLPRQHAEAEVVRRVRDLLAMPPKDARFPHAWFRYVVTPTGGLRRAYKSTGDLQEGKFPEVIETPFDIPALPTRD